MSIIPILLKYNWYYPAICPNKKYYELYSITSTFIIPCSIFLILFFINHSIFHHKNNFTKNSWIF